MHDLISGFPRKESVALLKVLLKRQRMAAGLMTPIPTTGWCPTGGKVATYKNLMLGATTSGNTAWQVGYSSSRPGSGETGQKVSDPLRGGDAAGRGTIKALHGKPQSLGEPGCGAALEKPTETRRGQWWLPTLCAASALPRRNRPLRPLLGNRAGVRQVMGFAASRSMGVHAPLVRNSAHAGQEQEPTLSNSGSRSVSRNRGDAFGSRQCIPSSSGNCPCPSQGLPLDKWDDYTGQGKRVLLHRRFSVDGDPGSDCRNGTRLNAMRFHILHRLPYASKGSGPHPGNLVPRSGELTWCA